MGEFWRRWRQGWQLETLLLGTGVAGLVVIAGSLGLIRLLEWTVIDQLFHLRPAAPPDRRIVIVTIGEDDIHFAGDWPMSDRLMAELVSEIAADQPRTIGLDIYRDIPVEPGHDELRAVWQATPGLIGVEKVGLPTIAPPPFLNRLKGQVAAVDLLLDGDSSVRRGVVSLQGQEGLGTRLALEYLKADGIELRAIDEARFIYGLGQAVFQPIRPGANGYRSAELGGYQILIDYRGNWYENFQRISMQAVLTGAFPEGFFRDRIVLIGAEAPSLNDFYPTPIGNAWLDPGRPVPGVAIHAYIASQMVAAALDGRPVLTPLPAWMGILWIWGWALGSAAIGRQFVRARWWSGMGLLLLPVAICAIAYGSFLQGWTIPIFRPALAAIMAASGSISVAFWERLQQSYRKLEDYNQTLEARVQQRTQQLAATNAELAMANAAITELNNQLQGENVRLVAELSVAQTIQKMVLPHPAELEAIAELDIAAYMDPAAEVGGDYYDIFQNGEDTMICIGDVTGHGLESGVVMLMAQTAIRALSAGKLADEPVRLLDALNRTLYDNIVRMGSEKNMTLAIAAYRQGRLRISGQHEETIIVRADGRIERIDTIDLGFPLGLSTEITTFIHQQEIVLAPGDLVLLYTDGISEAESPQRRLYGIERFCKVVSRWRHLSAAEIIDRAIADLRAHIGNQQVYDDITLIAFKQKQRSPVQ